MQTKFESKRAELALNLRDFSRCVENVHSDQLRVVAGLLRMLADECDQISSMEAAAHAAKSMH